MKPSSLTKNPEPWPPEYALNVLPPSSNVPSQTATTRTTDGLA
jgi:hypothetical protein